MKILIIPENQTYDRHIVKPVLERILDDLGSRATISVLDDRRIDGWTQATSEELLADVMSVFPMVNLFVLVIDRDCDGPSRDGILQARETKFGKKLVAIAAIEELETWMLAIQQRLPKPWGTVRLSCSPKEEFALPFLENAGWSSGVGGGYKRAIREITGSWRSLKSRCPEIVQLSEKIRQSIQPVET